MSKKTYKHLNQTERFYISKRLQAGDVKEPVNSIGMAQEISIAKLYYTPI